MFKKLILPATAAASLLFTSCSSTISSRVEKNPGLYQSLPPSEQALVSRGEIRQGMGKDAVFLAWGRPDRTSAGENKKGRFERWIYTELEPVYTQNFYGGFGYYRGGGYYGRRRYGFYPGFGTHVSYLPRAASYVDFRNERVSTWQRGNAGPAPVFD